MSDQVFSVVLDDQQIIDLRDGCRQGIVDHLTIRIKRLVRAARRRGERV